MTLVSSLDVPALCIVVIICQSLMVTYQVGAHLHLLNSVLCGEISFNSLKVYILLCHVLLLLSYNHIFIPASYLQWWCSVAAEGSSCRPRARTRGCLRLHLSWVLPSTAGLAGVRGEVIWEQYKGGFLFENKSAQITIMSGKRRKLSDYLKRSRK